MQIIDAFWEKRNLGVNTYEVRLDKSDLSDMDTVLATLNEERFKDAYVIVKMPVGNLEALHRLESAGYRFMETQFHMEKDLRHYETPKLVARFKKTVEQHEVPKTRADWQKVTDLMTPDLFHTDRIYLDPALTDKTTSCRRYQNWILDWAEKEGTCLYLYTYHDEPLGFGLVQIEEEKGVIHDVLEGVFEKYQDSGLGLSMFDKGLTSYRDRGLKKLVTAICSNNLPIVKLDLTFGYMITGEEYILRKCKESK